MIKVIVGGTEIQTTPIGWEDLTTTIRLDRELKGLFTVMDVSLTFIGDGYDILKSNFDSFGYSYNQSVSILQRSDDGNYYHVFTGTIFYKDIEFTEGVEGSYAKVQLTDNSFFAKIKNNKNLKAKVWVGLSKNGKTITPAQYWPIRFFEPSTGTYYTPLTGVGYERQDTGFTAYEVLKFLVDYMSDGEVDFISDTFNIGGQYQGTILTCGYIPRFTSGAIGTGVTQELFELNFPDLSFFDVFSELNKLFNLGFVSGFNGSRPFIRVEEYSYLYPDNIIQDLSNVDKIKRKAASEYLYSKLLIGSEQIDDEPTLVSFPEKIRFVGFNSEEYAILADGSDRELDLVNSWIISSNIIEDLLVNATTVPTTWDNEIIMIHCDPVGVGSISEWKAVQSNWISTAPPYYYNELYNNENKALRWFSGLPSSIASYLNDATNKFRVGLSATKPVGPVIPAYSPIEFDDDTTPPNFDQSGLFDTSIGVNNYTVPTTGIYSFNIHLISQIYVSGYVIVRILRFDPTLSTVTGGRVLFNQNGQLGLIDYDLMATLHAEAGEKIIVSFYTSVAGDLYVGSYWESINAGSGGEYLEVNPNNYPIIRNTFEYPLSLTEFRNIQANPLGLFSFGTSNLKTYFAWIEELKYKHFKASSSFTLISNEKTN